MVAKKKKMKAKTGKPEPWKAPKYCGIVSGGDMKKRKPKEAPKGGTSEVKPGSKDSA